MSGAFVSIYGDPCRECGYGFSSSLADALQLIATMPGSFEDQCADARGSERHPDLSWSVVAYVCHVADNFHIWAERLAGIALGPSADITPYDENELAAARVYEGISLQGALFSLERSTGDFLVAVSLARKTGVAMRHPERGELSLLELTRGVAHDAVHHLWDIGRTLEA